MRSRTLLLGALLATAALLPACSDPPPPLGDSSYSGGDCVPFALGHPVADGHALLDNMSTSPVTVTSVKLISAHGLAMTAAWLIPLYKPPHGSLSYVGDAVYPDTKWPTWRLRQRIPGAVIKPHQTLNLVVGLTRTAARVGLTAGPVITYTAGGNTYTLQEQFAFAITAPDVPCPKGT